MKKIRLMIATFGVLAVSVAGVAAASNASAAEPCVVGKANNFTVNADKTITGSFEVKGDANCTQPVSVMTWNADSSLYPAAEFYTSQTVHAVKTETFGVGVHMLTVKLPVCSTDPSVVSGYQADIIAGANPATHITAPGTPGYYWEVQADGTFRVVDYKLGGDKCPAAPEKGDDTTEVVSDLEEPTELANTGPGSAAALFAAATLAGVIGYRIVLRKNLARS